MFATLIVRVTLISLFFLYREINVKRKFHVIRYVPPKRVWFLGLFGLKTAIHFAHFCLESGIIFEGTTGVHGLSFRFNSNEEGNRNTRIRNAFEELFCLRSNLRNDDLINAYLKARSGNGYGF